MKFELRYECDECKSLYIIPWDDSEVDKETKKGPFPCRNRNCKGKAGPTLKG